MRLLSSQFQYNKDTRCFSAFASDLPSPFMGRLYPDACDLGFEMVSVKTRASAKFFLAKEDKDPDLGVFSWTFQPDTETLRRSPNLKGSSVVIFND